MKARIYRPTRNAMQSGMAGVRKWILEFTPAARPFVDPLMGWTGSQDTSQQVRLSFDTEAQAIEYAEHNGIVYETCDPQIRIIQPKSYAANFAYNKIN